MGMLPTQVPRFYAGVGMAGYGLVFLAVLAVGSGVGWGLALFRAGAVDLGRVLVVTPMVLVACTPLLVIGALRMFAERKVWRCPHCRHIMERA